MTVHQAVLARFEKEFNRKYDALVFEYIEHWLFNNRFLNNISEDDMYTAVKTSVGVTMYLRTGMIPEIID